MNEPIDAQFTSDAAALAVRESQPNLAPTGLFNTDDPVLVVQKAVAVADALMAVVKQKGWARRIGPKDHLEIQAWQTIAAMLSVSTECEWSRRLEDGTGWEARVVVRNARGMIIASAESQCTKSESKWRDRDDYAIRSMAQTRATSKALRMALGFIANIAGFDATPADEMPDTAPPPRPATNENPVKERLKALLRDERLTSQERGDAIARVTGDPNVSSITAQHAQAVIDALTAAIAEAESEIPL